MLISTFEYHTLFGNKPKEKISNEDIYGNTKIEIVTKTGFENEGS